VEEEFVNQHNVHLKDWFPLLVILSFLTLSTAILSGCTKPNQQLTDTGATATSQSTLANSNETPAQEASATATYAAINLPNGTEVMLGKQAANTQVAQHIAAIATEVALSPHPTEPDGPIYIESPIPTPTWAVGYGGWIMPENTFKPEYISCWYGYLNDKLLSVCAGHEQFGGNSQQGVIRIRVLEQDQVTIDSEDVYETPLIAGVVHIVVADSNSVTVASEDGQTMFTFDIATRQWVPNPPLPTPSVSPLPSPSASP
jgi:hypothetical protein